MTSDWNPMTHLPNTLHCAQDAIREAGRRIRPSNRRPYRSSEDNLGAADPGAPSEVPGMMNRIAARAARAEQDGAGNCSEIAAACFMQLRRSGVHPIDYMTLTNGDHAFVVIGRGRDSDDTDCSRWGDAAVVCDAWVEAAYPATRAQMVQNIPGAVQPRYRSLYRWDPKKIG